MYIVHTNNISSVFENHFSLLCPHCRIVSNVSAVSVPNYEMVWRFMPSKVIIGYRCDSCNSPIALRYPVSRYEREANRILLGDEYEVVERPLNTFEYEYLPGEVAKDFKEAVLCYSQGAFNAFAAMCRRTSQSVFMKLGAEEKTRVKNQLQEAAELVGLDKQTEEIFNQIIVSGHDGAHPHLPEMNEERAGLLFVLMKDVLTELFVRKAKLQEAAEARQKAIEARRDQPK